MVAQSPPFAAQNASHSAQLFRLAAFSAWRDSSGIVGPTDFAITAQGTPNMSVLVAAGRAWLRGTQVASVSGGTWSPQGGYYGYNDAPVTLTISSADPTNPRIDAVVAYAIDAFYSGASNTFVLGIVTGTPAATPAVPAVPNNGLLLGTVAVAANATSIVSGNIAQASALLTVARGGILPVTSTDATAGLFVGQARDHPTLGLQRWNGSAWAKPTPANAWTTLALNSSWTTYTETGRYPSAIAYRQEGDRVFLRGYLQCQTSVAAGAAVNSTVIPAALCPAANTVIYPQVELADAVRFEMQTTGTFLSYRAVTAPQFFSLDGMSWPIG